MSTKASPRKIVGLIEKLLEEHIDIAVKKNFGASYEVTVYLSNGHHTHFSGTTLGEALERAVEDVT